MQNKNVRTPGRSLWDRIWRDRSGKIVFYQAPSPWLIGWAVLAIVSVLSPSNHVASIFWWLSLGVLTIWSVIEIRGGVNYFRRGLGVFVLLMIIAGVFGVGR